MIDPAPDQPGVRRPRRDESHDHSNLHPERVERAARRRAVFSCSPPSWDCDREISDYRSGHFDEQMEILSCIGDVATNNDEPAVHAHMVLGRRDYSTLGGHLQSVEVFPTMEVILTETPAHLRKHVDPGTGLALIAADASSAGE